MRTHSPSPSPALTPVERRSGGISAHAAQLAPRRPTMRDLMDRAVDLAHLSARQRMVVTLLYTEALSDTEIAHRLGRTLKPWIEPDLSADELYRRQQARLDTVLRTKESARKSLQQHLHVPRPPSVWFHAAVLWCMSGRRDAIECDARGNPVNLEVIACSRPLTLKQQEAEALRLKSLGKQVAKIVPRNHELSTYVQRVLAADGTPVYYTVLEAAHPMAPSARPFGQVAGDLVETPELSRVLLQLARRFDGSELQV